MKSCAPKFKGVFKGKSFVSIDQITSRDEVERIFEVADEMRELVEKKRPSNTLNGYCIAQIFYQPSTRTFTSFLAASKWLGATAIPIHEMSAFSSAIKGESLEDTVKSLHQTTAADMIVIRHPNDNSAEIASEASPVPIVNAGSGKKEHPTQAVLDLYSIKNELGRTNDLNVVFMGDLKYGRTIKSLGKLLSVVNSSKLSLVSPEELCMPPTLVDEWRAKGMQIEETDDIQKVISKADVIYVTRIQKEWFEAEGKTKEYQKIKSGYEINPSTLKNAKQKMIILHPLPRVGEITYEVDEDPRAAYFRQMRCGLYTRMALMRMILLGK